MKKLLIIPIICLLLCGCAAPADPVLESFPGTLQGQTWSSVGFQDYTMYGKYACTGMEPDDLKGNEYFIPVEEEDVSMLEGFVKDHAQWIRHHLDCGDCLLGEEYDFNPVLLRGGGWYYLDVKDPDWAYSNYNLYFFSSKTMTLYYFHNNL